MVKNWGPLWVYSCFGFESMNGHLRKSCHGTRLVLAQMIHTVRMRQLLPLRAKQLATSMTPKTAAFITTMLGQSTSSHSESEVEVKGRITHKKLDAQVTSALLSANFVTRGSTDSLPTLPVFKRVRHKSILYTAVDDQHRRARNGSICIFRHQSELHFGSITQFCFSKGQKLAVIKTFEETGQSILKNTTLPAAFNNLMCHSIDGFIFCVKKLSLTNTIVAVPVTDLCAKCIHIPIKGSPVDLLFPYQTCTSFIKSLPSLLTFHVYFILCQV